jgi:hypothetical protein
MKHNMKYKLFIFLLLVVISSFTGLIYSQVPDNGYVMQTKVYKTIRLTKLKLYIFQPSVRNDMEKLPAIVFFTEVLGQEDMPGSLYLNVSIWLNVGW